MPVVHNAKSRARDFCYGASRSRARHANNGRSWFVLALAISLGTVRTGGFDLQTVICLEPSVSRESVAAAKLQDPADASLTIWWRPF